MPLLGKKPFTLASPPKNIKSGDRIFYIEQTNEIFKSYDEYVHRIILYSSQVWSCRYTSEASLTYEDALKSEKKALKDLEKFPKCWEKPLLQILHHSVQRFDVLLDQCYSRCQLGFAEGESVKINTEQHKGEEGKIVRVIEEKEENNSEGASACSSPSSDKENKNLDAKKSLKTSPSKEKCQVHRYYDVKYSGGVLKRLKFQDLVRVKKPPSKDLVKLLIKVNVARASKMSNSPWVVKGELVKKYSLPSKFDDFVVSPSKKIFESPSRPAGTPSINSSSKKTMSSNKKVQSTLDSLRLGSKKSVTPQSEKTETKSSKTGSKTKEKKQKKLTKSPSKSEDNSKKKTTPKSTPSKSSEKSSKKTVSSKVTPKSPKSGTPIKKTPSKKDGKSPKSGKGETPSKNGIKSPHLKAKKQLTLIDLAKTKDGSKPSPSRLTKKQKNLAEMLLAASKKDNQSSLTKLVSQAINEVSSPNVLKLPTTANEKVKKKWEELRAKQRWKLMSLEERQKVIEEKRQKRKEERDKLREEKVKLKREEKQRYEDSELKNLKSLPLGLPVSLPSGLPAQHFGDVAMIVEFLFAYRELLTPDNTMELTTDLLMKALVEGESGQDLLAQILLILLQTLLQDQVTQAKELGMKLSEVSVNKNSATEVTRLYFKWRNSSEENNDKGSEDGSLSSTDSAISVSNEEVLPNHILEFLEDHEFYELEVEDKLQVVIALCNEVLESDSLEGFIEDKMDEITKLRKQTVGEQKKRNDQIREEKEKKRKEREEKQKEKEETEKKQQEQGGQDADSQANQVPKPAVQETKKPEKKNDKQPEKKNDKQPEQVEDYCLDLGSIVRRRRELAARNNIEREKQEKEEKLRRLKMEEDRQREMKLEQWKVGIQRCQNVLRLCPIGYDRHHRRYWVLNGALAGLYVEEGWMKTYGSPTSSTHSDVCGDDEHMDDKDDECALIPTSPCKTPIKNIQKTPSKSAANSPAKTPKKTPLKTPVKKIKTPKKSDVQDLSCTSSHRWLVYNTVEELDIFLASLAGQGVRESALIISIKDQYKDIVASIKKQQNTQPLKATTEAEKVLSVDFIREELVDIASRIVRGNLGEMDDLDVYEKMVLESSHLNDLEERIINLEEALFSKFTKGILDGNSSNNSKESWVLAVRSAKSHSRLHFLLGVLDACIQWDKSAENAKCKICRHNKKEEQLLLCDDCNQAYHLFCLRPALHKVPEGHWSCLVCRPAAPRTNRGLRNYKEDTDGNSDDSGVEDSDEANDDSCSVCQYGGELVCCDTCPRSYHKECHEPQLRNVPRGAWSCQECRNPSRKTRNQTSKSAKGKSSPKPNSRRKGKPAIEESSEDEDDSEEEEEEEESGSESEEEEEVSARSTRAKRRAVDSDEEEESEEEEPPKKQRKQSPPSRRGSSATKTTRQAKKTKTDSPDEDKRPQSARRSGEEKKSHPRRKLDSPTQNTKPRKRISSVGSPTEEQNNSKKRRGNPDMDVCEDIVKTLILDDVSWPFRDPVSTRDVPDYYDLVSDPMDLSTIKVKFQSLQYSELKEFISDVRLICSNCDAYNLDSSAIGKTGIQFRQKFEELLNEHFPHLSEIKQKQKRVTPGGTATGGRRTRTRH